MAAVLAEVPDRQLRLADDEAAGLRLWDAVRNCGTDEQLLFDDVVYGWVHSSILIATPTLLPPPAPLTLLLSCLKSIPGPVWVVPYLPSV